jgi:hypothetical protein
MDNAARERFATFMGKSRHQHNAGAKPSASLAYHMIGKQPAADK